MAKKKTAKKPTLMATVTAPIKKVGEMIVAAMPTLPAAPAKKKAKKKTAKKKAAPKAAAPAPAAKPAKKKTAKKKKK